MTPLELVLRTFLKTLAATALAFAIAGPAAARPTLLTSGAVASPDLYGALAAKAVLAKGGNAVDAAVATAFALAVTYPEAGNLGGGGFMTLVVDGKPYFLDYRESAPGAATANMYLDAKGEVVPNLSIIGNLSSGVPGTPTERLPTRLKLGIGSPLASRYIVALAPAGAVSR